MEKNHQKIVIDYFNQWLSCSNEESFNTLFYQDFRENGKNSKNEIFETHKLLVNKFIYKKFRCRAPFEDLTKDFIRISQHCLSFAMDNELPNNIFAKFQVQQYLKIFKEICDMPELLDKDLYQYWVYTTKDQFNFQLDCYDLMGILSKNLIKKRKRRSC